MAKQFQNKPQIGYLQKVFPEDDELEPGEVRRYLIGQAENIICSFENIVFETPIFSFDLL